ncbi:MAG: type II toxin-antitoxin system RelE/ParE family toxin [Nitrospira sp.]|nr:type II toxin-antitoxin system RelE/ParE family toxin [Nitrospira sp.]
MVNTFRHKRLQAFFETGSKAGIRPHHAACVQMATCTRLDLAKAVVDMNVPGWGLHALAGTLAGQCAVSVSANWRPTVGSDGENAVLVDYESAVPGRNVERGYSAALSLTVTQASAHLGVTRAALSRVLNGRAAISPDMALR